MPVEVHLLAYYLSNRRRFQTEHRVLLRLDEIVVGRREDVRVVRRLLGSCKDKGDFFCDL